jgi:hypothetical protein
MLRTGHLATLALAGALSFAFAADASSTTKLGPSQFLTDVLAGGTTNEFSIPAKPEDVDTPTATDALTIDWKNWKDKKPLPPNWRCVASPSKKISIRSKEAAEGDATKTRLLIRIPSAPCLWPLTQTAHVTIRAKVLGTEQLLFDEDVDVSVHWLPLLVTLLVLALIYPGCAMVAFYVKQRNYEKDCQIAKEKNQPKPPEPSFIGTLDPVQITASAYGRGNLSKLQIFGFSLIVFGLLLYYQLRYGVLAGMSTDVMMLMGISAVGAVGGKLAYVKNRRLSLENWAWLRRKNWLPTGKDVAGRAKWSELFLDSDTKEFDVYSFQMAVFSLVLAVALVRSGLSGLASFKISPELLALLGLSQTVFIGGKATETTGYSELNKKLDEVRQHENKYLELFKDADAKEQAKAPAELDAFHTSALQAAEMFWSVYIQQLDSRPRETEKDKVIAMVPGAD